VDLTATRNDWPRWTGKRAGRRTSVLTTLERLDRELVPSRIVALPWTGEALAKVFTALSVATPRTNPALAQLVASSISLKDEAILDQSREL